MHTLPFYPADILLPRTGFEKWAVVACDQFTSQPEYWEEAERLVGSAPSALHLILPEVYLSSDNSARIRQINAHMNDALRSDLFVCYPHSMIYVERTLPAGGIRHGIVGCIDLAAYDFRPEKKALIRATEGTVLERIPPRVAIRRDAPLELPHVMLLIDDPLCTVIEPLKNENMPVLYDFDLMLGGGHLRGALIEQPLQEKILSALHALTEGQKDPFLFAVGDGNHSLATAKACYEADPTPENRYALVEIVNVHDQALVFEPIYRLVTHVNSADIRRAAQEFFTGSARPVTLVMPDCEVRLATDGFPVSEVQSFLDTYLASHPEAQVDYIHGEDVLRRLAVRADCAGFLFGGMEKSELFPIVSRDGTLPRKTFSMGEAQSKRYYMEARKIRS